MHHVYLLAVGLGLMKVFLRLAGLVLVLSQLALSLGQLGLDLTTHQPSRDPQTGGPITIHHMVLG